MNICLVSNLKKGGYGESTRPYYLSTELKKQGHKILHLCDRENGSEDGIEYLNKAPFGAGDNRIARTANFLYLTLRLKMFSPDIIYVHQFNNARWAIATRSLPKAPLVFDAHTSIYFEDKAFGAGKEKLDDVFRIEEEICQKSDFIIAASYTTRQLLIEQFKVPEKKIFAVENATSIHPVAAPAVTSNNKFVCSATLPQDGFKSNEMALDFLFEVAEKMQQADANVQFQVLGGGEKPLPPTTNVSYTGYVKDYEGCLLQSDICLAPYPDNAVCGGVRNKVCDYMALGKAMVSTKEGIRGFRDLMNGVDYVEANTAEEFTSAILRLKNNQQLKQDLEKSVLEKSRHYQWSVRGREVNSIFKTITGKS